VDRLEHLLVDRLERLLVDLPRRIGRGVLVGYHGLPPAWWWGGRHVPRRHLLRESSVEGSVVHSSCGSRQNGFPATWKALCGGCEAVARRVIPWQTVHGGFMLRRDQQVSCAVQQHLGAADSASPLVHLRPQVEVGQ
jgi:hypothetical protein